MLNQLIHSKNKLINDGADASAKLPTGETALMLAIYLFLM
jgi:hypothetical protein